jgi:hypothetical protein
MNLFKGVLLWYLCIVGNLAFAQIISRPRPQPAPQVVVRRTPTRYAFSTEQQRRLDSLLRAYKIKADNLQQASPVVSARSLMMLQAETRQKAGQILTIDQKQNFQALSQDTVMMAFDKAVPPIKSFPFPPPAGYTYAVLDDATFSNCRLLGDAGSIIYKAITSSNCNYEDVGYYAIPDGFVVVTKVEEINDDATSVSGSDRFAEGQYQSMSILDFFAPRKGYFRVFAFLVTDVPFNATNTEVTAGNALEWIRLAANILPDAIKNKPFKPGYNCTVIVYEFKSEDANTHLSPLLSPRFSAQTHLQKSHIAESLQP